MAKIVSTKFGDRRLVHLPPVNMSGNRTAHMDTIAPASDNAEYRQRVFEAKIHRQYAYRSRAVGRESRHAWEPSRTQHPQGNLVTDAPPPRFGDQIFQQLYQEANTATMVNYDKGQYPVIPPVGGQPPNYMQYTNHGLSSMPQQQPIQQPLPPQQQLAPPQQLPMAASYPQHFPAQSQNFQQQQPLPPPPAQQQQQSFNSCASCNTQGQPTHGQPGNNPNERHIYYGPNGEVLPGPPSGLSPSGPFDQCPDDFAIEGLLQYGKLAHMSLIEAQRGFPKLPDYLIRDLVEKYGHIERTVVRIVMRGGQAFVHASMDMPSTDKRYHDYVPVVLDEDEEFDYDKFYDQYQRERQYNREYGGGGGGRDFGNRGPPRQYRSPPPIPRSFPLYDVERERRRSPDIRPDTIDPASHLRWKKHEERGRRTVTADVDRGRGIITAPVFPPPSSKDRRRDFDF